MKKLRIKSRIFKGLNLILTAIYYEVLSATWKNALPLTTLDSIPRKETIKYPFFHFSFFFFFQMASKIVLISSRRLKPH